MKSEFVFDRIETRSLKETGSRFPKYIVKGYAAVPELPHVYNWQKDSEGRVVKSCKSLFTKNFIASINKQLQHKRVFVDALHETATNLNSAELVSRIKQKVGKEVDIGKETASLEANLKLKELPMFKLRKFDVLDKGLYIEAESNPYFAELDEKHEKYYGVIMKSLFDKYINGISMNFKTTDVVNEDGLDKINDGDLFGFSLVPDGSMGSGTEIVDIAMRSIMEIRQTEEKPMEKQEKKESIEQPKGSQVDIDKLVEQKAQEKAEEMLKQKEIESQKQEQTQQLEDLKGQLKELQSKLDKKEEKIISEGTVSDPTQKTDNIDPETLKKRVDELTWKELATLQAEFGDKLPKYTKQTEYAGKHNDPRVTTKIVPLDPEMEPMHKRLVAQMGDDLVFQGDRSKN